MLRQLTHCHEYIGMSFFKCRKKILRSYFLSTASRITEAIRTWRKHGENWPFSIPEVQKSAALRRSAVTFQSSREKPKGICLELHHQLWRSEDPLVHFLRLSKDGWMIFGMATVQPPLQSASLINTPMHCCVYLIQYPILAPPSTLEKLRLQTLLAYVSMPCRFSHFTTSKISCA